LSGCHRRVYGLALMVMPAAAVSATAAARVTAAEEAAAGMTAARVTTAVPVPAAGRAMVTADMPVTILITLIRFWP
jgi:hypothetical protein